MKKNSIITGINVTLSIWILLILSSCVSKTNTIETIQETRIKTKSTTSGKEIEISFEKGSAFNYPLMAIWIEDNNGNYIETLYISESIAKGTFKDGNSKEGKWKPGTIKRPAALPYWGHKRGVKNSDGYYLPDILNPMPDAVSGASPKGNFELKSRIPANLTSFNILLEINQSWDWNSYWTNSKFPDEPEYISSSQPAIVYSTKIDLNSGIKNYTLKPIGHSHHSGKTGELFPDLSTITTALHITENIKVTLLP